MRAELIKVPGLTGIRYQPEDEVYVISYRQGKVKIADLLSAIWVAGRKQSQELQPEVID